jgi:hypothetical protein
MNEYPVAFPLQNSRGLVREEWTVRAKHSRGLPGYSASKISSVIGSLSLTQTGESPRRSSRRTGQSTTVL